MLNAPSGVLSAGSCRRITELDLFRFRQMQRHCLVLLQVTV